MNLCVVLGAAKVVYATSVFTLAWTHSVEKTRWEEDWRVRSDGLEILEARIEGSGAGMEPAPGARLVNGTWRWRPALPPLRNLRLTSSDYAADYAICWAGRCSPLRALARSNDVEVVTLTAC